MYKPVTIRKPRLEITFIYKGCDENDASLTRYRDMSVEAAKFLYKKASPKIRTN